jgi:ATP-dependent DNA ligase
VSRVRFIPPAVPKLRSSPPTGQGWSYEVKLDGFRIQLHKVWLAVTLFGKNGGNLTTRFPTISAAIITLPVRSCVIDGELIAAGAEGQPDFMALLHGRHVPVCVYAFDLMEIEGRDLRDEPLEKRRARLSDCCCAARATCSGTATASPIPLSCWPSASASASRALGQDDKGGRTCTSNSGGWSFRSRSRI